MSRSRRLSRVALAPYPEASMAVGHGQQGSHPLDCAGCSQSHKPSPEKNAKHVEADSTKGGRPSLVRALDPRLKAQMLG